MTHKFITVTKQNKHILPYLNTTVTFEKSFGEIQGLLMKFGCSDLLTRQTPSTVPGTKMTCTLYTIGFLQKGNHFLIEFPVFIVPVGRYNEREVRMNVSGRIMVNKIKALLVDVEMEFLSFEQAMMPFQLIAGRNGQPTTIQDYIDENRAEITTGKNVFMLGDGAPWARATIASKVPCVSARCAELPKGVGFNGNTSGSGTSKDRSPAIMMPRRLNGLRHRTNGFRTSGSRMGSGRRGW